MEPDVKRPGLYLWSAGDVVPAKYEAEIFEFALKLLIDVGTEGQRDAEIRIAEPAEVAVIAVEGVFYRTLSEAAKAVTDSHWNGKLFWGLSKRKKSK
jgi:hypothetical protein